MEKICKQKPQFTPSFLILAILFIVCLIIANMVEIKTVKIGSVTVTAGLAVFPLSYIINDCLVEIYGFRKARLVIWLGFAMSLMTAIMLNIAIALPAGEDWQSQQAMEEIYGSVPRIMFASFAAFICGSMVNAYVMSRMKRSAVGSKSNGTWKFSLRAIVSTLWGEGVDSVIFFPIAFLGTLPTTTIITLIISQALLKTGYEILILPITISVVKRLKRIEGSDTVDSEVTNYSWWRITDL